VLELHARDQRVIGDNRVSMPPPQFFFGAMSPYSWFAAERIDKLMADARWRGVLAGAIFKAHGRVSWGMTDRRAAGMADCEVRAAAYGLGEIRWPKQWPTSDLLVARAMAYGETRGKLKAFALAAMRLSFLDGADLGELPAVLEAARRTAIGEEEMQRALREQATKDALRRTTDEALTFGVFGIPTLVVGNELFWGDDRLADAVDALGELTERKRGRPATAVRHAGGERSISS
jgi:2-hydroxychromene-2-carboxylate isomerase